MGDETVHPSSRRIQCKSSPVLAESAALVQSPDFSQVSGYLRSYASDTLVGQARRQPPCDLGRAPAFRLHRHGEWNSTDVRQCPPMSAPLWPNGYGDDDVTKYTRYQLIRSCSRLPILPGQTKDVGEPIAAAMFSSRCANEGMSAFTTSSPCARTKA